MKKRFFFILMLGLTLKTYSQAPSGAVAVDMGLSVKWASMNVGAKAAEDYGDYYCWGETVPYSPSNCVYKWCTKNYDKQTKYCTHDYFGIVDNKTTLEPSDDAAHVNWGEPWRMPTADEWTELREQCTWRWASLNGVDGYRVTARNGNSIFLPCAGILDDNGTNLSSEGYSGNYWSSTLCEDLSLNALNMYFHSGYPYGIIQDFRYFGHSIRPVCPVQRH